MTSLRVGNIPYKTHQDDLREVFEKFGDVGDVFIPTDRESGRPRGFAFVRFVHKRDAEDAMDDLNGRQFDGRELRVSIDEGRPRGGGRGGYGGGGRGGGRGYGGGRDDRGYGGGRRRSDSRDRRRSRSRSDSRGRRDRSNDRDRRDKSREKRQTRSRSRS